MTHEIFIPFWGEPALLFDTVESVLAQTVTDVRLIVLDDHYPDPSVAAYFAALRDERVEYIRHPENLGITENYREVVRRAQTEYVTILGCDDLLHPEYLDVVRRTIAAVPTADVIQPGVDIIDEHGEAMLPLVDRVKRALAPRARAGICVLQGQQMAASLMRGDWLYWPSLTFRTETLRRIDFREGLPIIQDLALLMDIAFDGGTLAYNPTLCFSYRRHRASASQKTLLDGTRFRDERVYFALAADIASSLGWRRAARAARVRLMSRLHALSELPHLIRRGTPAGVRSTLTHVFAH